ncbi:MAG: TIM barrel protein [Candidatus Aenigmatarchaeota archaeon]
MKLWKEISKINDDFNIFLENTREEPEKIAEFIDKINDERIKFCLDIEHMFVYSKSSLDKWIDVLANRLRYVHIHNSDGIKDQHLPLLKGKFDMKDVFIKVKSFDVCLEAFGDIKEIEEDVKRLIEWSKI